MYICQQLKKLKETLDLRFYIAKQIGVQQTFKYISNFFVNYFFSNELTEVISKEWENLEEFFEAFKRAEENMAFLEAKYPDIFTKDIFLGNQTFDEAFSEFQMFLHLRNQGLSQKQISFLLFKGFTISEIYTAL